MTALTTEIVKERLAGLGIVLPQPTVPTGNYVNCVKTSNNLLHVCGHNPQKEDGSLITGKLGDLTIEQGYEAARYCAINILGTLEQELEGDWSRLVRIVKVVGFVHALPDFYQHPAVINGASDLFVAVFGPEIGKHARSAVGMVSLPFEIATEVECVVEIK